MAQPNYAFWDTFDALNLSKWGHLLVEMEPVAIRNGIRNPGPADRGWKYDIWTWLKNRIKQLDSKPRRVAGETKIPRSLLMEIAKSDEYAALLNTFPKLKARPLFLFPEDRKGLLTTSRQEKGPPAAMKRLALLIRQELAPDRLTLSRARKWLQDSADSGGEVCMDDDSPINIGFDKIVFAPGRDKETIDYLLIGDETRHHMAMRTFEKYLQKANNKII